MHPKSKQYPRRWHYVLGVDKYDCGRRTDTFKESKVRRARSQKWPALRVLLVHSFNSFIRSFILRVLSITSMHIRRYSNIVKVEMMMMMMMMEIILAVVSGRQ